MSLGLRSAFVGALESGRKRDGLTASHMAQLLGEGRRPKVDAQWDQIRRSPFVQVLTTQTGEPFFESITRYFRAVAKRLSDQKRWVVDVTLALRMEPTLEYAGDLTPSSTRSKARRNQARALLRSRKPKTVDFSEVPEAGSTYVSKVEDPSLEAFASLLDVPVAGDFAEMGLDPSAFSEFIASKDPTSPADRPRVVVLGGAVMDLNFRIPDVPEAGASRQALNFKAFPGGKGLTQAVACARLGMQTSLISVIGDEDDKFGKAILEFLDSEGVDTSLIDRRSGEDSPVTAVFTFDGPRGSFAIGWKNEQNLFFSPKNLRSMGRAKAIEECQFFLTSFELPSNTVEAGLTIAKKAKATTIVTPAPPYEQQLVDPQHHRKIDYLVANAWELTEFARLTHREVQGRDQIDELAKPLVRGQTGLRNLLVVHGLQCHAYLRPSTARKSELKEFPVPAWPTKDRETAGDRDAFCAMLAKELHLISTGETSGIERAVYWATAAMARAGGQLSVPDSMPTFDEVASLIDEGYVALPE